LLVQVVKPKLLKNMSLASLETLFYLLIICPAKYLGLGAFYLSKRFRIW